MFLCISVCGCSAGSRCSVTVSRRLWTWLWMEEGEVEEVGRAAWRIWPEPSLMTSDACQGTTTAVTVEPQVISANQSISQPINRSLHLSSVISVCTLLWPLSSPLFFCCSFSFLSLCRSWLALNQPGYPNLHWVLRDPQGDGGPRLQDPVLKSGQFGYLRPAG